MTLIMGKQGYAGFDFHQDIQYKRISKGKGSEVQILNVKFSTVRFKNSFDRKKSLNSAINS